jgi:hypothetical protein
MVNDRNSNNLKAIPHIVSSVWGRHSPRQIKWFGAFIIFSFLAGIVWLALNSGALRFGSVRIQNNEIDLSGIWKIWLEDRPNFASPHTSDADWCRIIVPNSGIRPEPPSSGESPSTKCPASNYPVDQMRNSIYWYRKAVTIPANYRWSDPSIFLGAIKRRGWVYWDGKLIGIANVENAPSFLPLEQAAVIPGVHLLAVRVQSGEDQNPGIFHAYDRKVALGEFRESAKSVRVMIQQQYLEPFLVVVMQVFGLLIILYLISRVEQATDNLVWLAVYFGASGVYALSNLWGHTPTSVALLQSMAMSGLSFSLVGFGNSMLVKKAKYPLWNGGVIFFTAMMALSAQWILLHKTEFQLVGMTLEKIILIGGLGVLLLFQIPNAILQSWSSVRSNENALPFSTWTVIFVLVVLHLSQVSERLLWARHAQFFHLPVITSSLTLLVLILSVEQYIQRERQLSFFGRFIRSGLRGFLSSGHKMKPEASLQAVFRGRHLPMMKIDIVGSTATCFDMPYGARRLYQHIWYSLIDQVSEGLTLFDRPEGDGSIYYFDDRNPSVTCKSVFELADQIHCKVLPMFDAHFKCQLKDFIQMTPDIQAPMKHYERRYHERFGRDFWDHETKIRFAFTFGIVDEGLWGLPSQSHYDLSGNAIILLSRLEKEAKASEMVLSKEFYEEASRMSESFPPKEWAGTWEKKMFPGLGDLQFMHFRLKEQNQGAA